MLTQELADAILADILRTGRIQLSVEANGLAWRTYTEWADEGRDPWAGFVRACNAAKRRHQLGLVESLVTDDDAKWKAWLLERDREDGYSFGQAPQNHQHNHQHVLQPPLPVDSRPVLDAEAAVMAELAAEGGTDGQG